MTELRQIILCAYFLIVTILYMCVFGEAVHAAQTNTQPPQIQTWHYEGVNLIFSKETQEI